MAASTLRETKTYLGAQFRRLRTKLGAPIAIKAMAAKLARLVYRMLRYGMKYVDQGAAVYVALPLTYRGTSAADRKQKVQQALERVGMAHRLRHYPSQLSGGQQQRVAVARALVGDPLILMADEPTGNLDSKNGEAVMELLRDLHRYGATICMVTMTSAMLISRNAPFTCSTGVLPRNPMKPLYRLKFFQKQSKSINR